MKCGCPVCTASDPKSALLLAITILKVEAARRYALGEPPYSEADLLEQAASLAELKAKLSPEQLAEIRATYNDDWTLKEPS